MAVYLARREVRVRPKNPHATGCYLKIVSNNSSDVVITCNGTTYTSVGGADFTMTAYGHAYYGELNIEGLTDLKYYDWTVTQGAFTDSGYCARLPKRGEAHKVVLYSCDNNTNFSNQTNNNPQTVTGNWNTIKAMLDAGDFISLIVGIDDFSGYADSKVVDDTYDVTCSQWQAAASIANGGNANDASLAYLAYYGCLGSTNTITEGDLTVNADLICHWGREENRLYCGNRISSEELDGDHEYLDDIGFDTDVTAGSNPRWATYQVTDGEGEIALNKLVRTSGRVICNLGANDAHANHWVIRAGNIKLLAHDQVTNSDGGIGTTNSIPSVQMTTVYGTSQLTDIKAEINDAPMPFNLLLMTNGLMYMADGATSNNAHLAQHPLFNHCTAEYEALFTNTTNGLASNGIANGALGVTVAVSGDLHRRNVLRYENAAYAGNDALDLEHWHTGTINGSSNFSNSTGLSVGDTYENAGNIGTAAADVKATLLHDETDDSGDKVYSFVIVEDMPQGKPVMRMSHVDTNGDIVYQREYTTGKGNLSKEIGLDYKQGLSNQADYL